MAYPYYRKRLLRAFGKNEIGMPDFPARISNVCIARIQYGNYMGCTYCFPHGYETVNATALKRKNHNWKRYRKTQWKPKK